VSSYRRRPLATSECYSPANGLINHGCFR
jgi:hypothetical protein